jgi:hypothetical protein
MVSPVRLDACNRPGVSPRIDDRSPRNNSGWLLPNGNYFTQQWPGRQRKKGKPAVRGRILVTAVRAWIGEVTVDDVGRGFSRLILFCAGLGAGLQLGASIRTRGLRRSALFFVLGTGLPAAGELLATGPLKLLRHRLRYRVAGVPLAVLLGWYAVIHGSYVIARRVAEHARLGEDTKRVTVPALAALTGVGLDLILDPVGLDVGLWEWNVDGVYAGRVVGSNGHRGVPLINYLGWISLVGGATYVYGPGRGEKAGGRLTALFLLPCYLAAVWWAFRRRKFGYLLLSAPFPLALYAAIEKG